jgi:hypothetical protein
LVGCRLVGRPLGMGSWLVGRRVLGVVRRTVSRAGLQVVLGLVPLVLRVVLWMGVRGLRLVRSRLRLRMAGRRLDRLLRRRTLRATKHPTARPARGAPATRHLARVDRAIRPRARVLPIRARQLARLAAPPLARAIPSTERQVRVLPTKAGEPHPVRVLRTLARRARLLPTPRKAGRPSLLPTRANRTPARPTQGPQASQRPPARG